MRWPIDTYHVWQHDHWLWVSFFAASLYAVNNCHGHDGDIMLSQPVHYLDGVTKWGMLQKLKRFNLSYHKNNIHIDGLVQGRRNSSALAMELRLSCTNPDGLVQGRRNSNALAMELRLSCTNPSI